MSRTSSALVYHNVVILFFHLQIRVQKVPLLVLRHRAYNALGRLKQFSSTFPLLALHVIDAVPRQQPSPYIFTMTRNCRWTAFVIPDKVS